MLNSDTYCNYFVCFETKVTVLSFERQLHPKCNSLSKYILNIVKINAENWFSSVFFVGDDKEYYKV